MKIITKFTKVIMLCTLIRATYSISPEEQLLFQHATENNPQELEQLLKMNPNLDINAQDSNGWTALHHAVKDNSLNAFMTLLTRGANIEIKNKKGSTPLHLAISLENKDIAILLLARDADVNAQNKDGWTPLHITAGFGDAELLSLVMSNALIDISHKTIDNRTALDLAQYFYHLELSNMIETKDKENTKFLRLLFFAIKFALENNRPKTFTGLIANNRKIVLALREAQTGNTVFHLAVLTKDHELIKIALHYLPELITIKNGAQKKPLELPQAQQFLIKYLVQPFFHRYEVLDSILEISAY